MIDEAMESYSRHGGCIIKLLQTDDYMFALDTMMGWCVSTEDQFECVFACLFAFANALPSTPKTSPSLTVNQLIVAATRDGQEMARRWPGDE